MWKWVLILLAGAAAIYYVMDSNKMDTWNESMREGSEERSGVNVETAPVPDKSDD